MITKRNSFPVVTVFSPVTHMVSAVRSKNCKHICS